MLSVKRQVSKGFQRFIHNPSREVCTELKTNSSSVIHEQNRGYTKRHGHTRRRGGGGGGGGGGLKVWMHG